MVKAATKKPRKPTVHSMKVSMFKRASLAHKRGHAGIESAIIRHGYAKIARLNKRTERAAVRKMRQRL